MKVHVTFHPFNQETGIDTNVILDRTNLTDEGLVWDREEHGEKAAIAVAIAVRVMALEGCGEYDNMKFTVNYRIEGWPEDSDLIADFCQSGTNWNIPDDVPMAKVYNPYAKYLPDGTIDMLNVDMNFNHPERLRVGTVYKGRFTYGEYGKIIMQRVDVGADLDMIGTVEAVISESQTTEDGFYCEIIRKLS